MKLTTLFGDEDVAALRQSHNVVKDQVEAILNGWYGLVGANRHLLASFTDTDAGQPVGDSLDAARARFGRWIPILRAPTTIRGRSAEEVAKMHAPAALGRHSDALIRA